MKASNKLILITCTLLGLVSLSYAAYLAPYLEPEPRENGQLLRELSLSEDQAIPEILDSISGSYHYIRTNFSPLYLDTESDGQVVSRCLNPVVADHLQLKILNDTLFVYYRHPEDIPGHAVFNMRDYVVASARNLKGITVSDHGNVLNISPFGKERRFQDVPGKSPSILNRIGEKPPLKGEGLQLHFENGGVAQLYLEVETLKLSATEKNHHNNTSRAYLSGRCRSMVIDHRSTYFSGDTYQLRADSVKVYTHTQYNQPDALIKIRAETFLQADMDGWTDVLYQGKPAIKKRERGPGRLINANRME